MPSPFQPWADRWVSFMGSAFIAVIDPALTLIELCVITVLGAFVIVIASPFALIARLFGIKHDPNKVCGP